MERTSGDICLKTSPGFNMNQKLNIKSCYIFRITISNDVTIKTQIMLCSS